MADDLELVEIDNDAPSQEERDRFEELVGMIRTRCNGAGIEIAEDEGGDFDVNYDLYFSVGRERRRITIWDMKDAEVLLSSKFENIRFLEDYHAFFLFERKSLCISLPNHVGVSPAHGVSSLS